MTLRDPTLLELADEGSEKEEKSLAQIDVVQCLRSFDGVANQTDTENGWF